MTGSLPALLRASSPALPARGAGALVLEAPRRATSVVLGRLAPLLLESGRRLYVADGANCFDPYAFSREARRRGLREEVLDRVFVSRAFTIHQLAAVTGEMLGAVARESPGALLAVLGADHLFLEETLRTAERARVLGGVMDDLEGLRRGGACLLVTHEHPPDKARWWRPLLEFGDVRWRVRAQGRDGWHIDVERGCDGADAADLQHLLAGGD